MNTSDTAKADISAVVFESQMPSISNNSGESSTDAVWKSRVRKKDIAAETPPSLSAVKKDEAKMFKPHSKNENENSLKAWFVSSNKSLSYPTNIRLNGADSTNAAANSKTPEPPIKTVLFLSRFLSSEWLRAP